MSASINPVTQPAHTTQTPSKQDSTYPPALQREDFLKKLWKLAQSDRTWIYAAKQLVTERDERQAEQG